jgi:hypothetical protein
MLWKLSGGRAILLAGNFRQFLPVTRSDKQELTQQSHISKKNIPEHEISYYT